MSVYVREPVCVRFPLLGFFALCYRVYVVVLIITLLLFKWPESQQRCSARSRSIVDVFVSGVPFDLRRYVIGLCSINLETSFVIKLYNCPRSCSVKKVIIFTRILLLCIYLYVPCLRYI